MSSTRLWSSLAFALLNLCACEAKKNDSENLLATPRVGSQIDDEAKGASKQDACMACRQQHCSNYQGAFDLMKGCFGNDDKNFASECQEALACAQKTKCGYGPLGAALCFCGTDDLAACQNPGVANGPCQKEFMKAARTSDLKEVALRFGDVKFPSGVAHYLNECDRDMCPACRVD